VSTGTYRAEFVPKSAEPGATRLSLSAPSASPALSGFDFVLLCVFLRGLRAFASRTPSPWFRLVRVSIKIRWLTVVLAFSLMPGWPASPAADSEDELRAATVWLFMQYSQLTPGADGAVTVGVMGRASFEQALRRTLEGKSSGGHPVRVVEIQSDLRCCQVVYLATGKSEEIRQVLQTAQPLHTLTIGESDRFLEHGGAVNLFISDGHIGFETSLDALDRCGVTISSNLLKFGQIRNRGKGPVAK